MRKKDSKAQKRAKERDRKIHIYCNSDLWSQFKEKAKSMDLSASQLLRQLIRDSLGLSLIALFISACGENTPLEFRENLIYKSNAAIADNALPHGPWVESVRKSNDTVMYGYERYPAFDALVNLYKLTNDARYIELGIQMGEVYFSLAKDRNGDGYLDWNRYDSVDGNGVLPVHMMHHFEWRGAVGVAYIASEVINHSELSHLKARAENLITLIEKHVFEKWEDVMNTKSVTHMFSRAGSIAIYLYRATGDELYRNQAETLAIKLKSNMTYTETTALWNCRAPIDNCGYSVNSVDMNHAGDTVNFIVEAYKEGIVFDLEDIKLVAGSVKYLMWNGQKFSPFMNGEYGEYRQPNVGTWHSFWIKLASYDTELRNIYTEWLEEENILSDRNKFVRANIYSGLALAYDSEH